MAGLLNDVLPPGDSGARGPSLARSASLRIEARRWRWQAWLGGWPLAGLVLLTLVALAVDLRHSPPTPDLGETPAWWPVVRNVAHGRGYVMCNPTYFPSCTDTDPTAMREPVPVLLFAGVAALAHDSLSAEAGLQVLVHLAILVGVVLLTRQLAGWPTALLAGLLWVLYIPARRLVPQVSGDLLATLGLTWGVLAFVYAQRTDRKRAWLAAGVCLGLGALSRSVVLAAAPALALGLLVWPPASDRRLGWRVRRGLLLLGVCGLVQLPWAVRNELTFGRPVLGSTLTGYNLFRQDQQLPRPDYLRYVRGSEGLDAIRPILAQRADVHGNENEAQMEAIYRQEALRIIAAHPLRYATLVGARFLMLWFNWTVPESVPEAHQTLATDPGYVAELQQLVLLGAGVLGARLLGWRRGWPLMLSVVVICLAYMAVIAQMRYSVPLVPLMIAPSAVAATRAAQRLPGVALGLRARWARLRLPPRVLASPRLGPLLTAARWLECESYALWLVGREPRTPWYAKGLALGGVACALGPVDALVTKLPAANGLLDVLAVLLGVLLARQLVPASVLAECRQRARGALARSGNQALNGWVLAGWLLAIGLAIASIIWDPI